MIGNFLIYMALALVAVLGYVLPKILGKRTEKKLWEEMSTTNDKALIQLIEKHRNSSFVDLYIEEAERRGLGVK